MRIGLMRFSWIAALAASWGLTWITSATPAQDRLGKTAPTAQAGTRDLAKKLEASPNRTMEVQVELALMGDSITFPYFLEAHVAGTRMELRGFVPDKQVQDHALKLARLNSPLTVIDGTRLHSSLMVKPTRLSPDKLHDSVHTALSKSLPTSSKSLRVECDTDGKVVVAGSVRTIEEKLAVSQSLRRLHGCSCVRNLTQVGEIAGGTEPRVAASSPPSTLKPPLSKVPTARPERTLPDILPVQAKEPVRTPPAATAPPTDKKADGPLGGFFGKMFGKKKTGAPATTTEAPPPKFPTSSQDPVKVITNVDPRLPKNTGWGAPPKPAVAPPTVTATPTGKSGGTAPYEASGVIVAPTEGAPKKAAKALSPAQVRSRLETAFPKARPIVVTPEGGNKLKVELTTRSSEDGNDIAGRVLSLPELSDYDVNLHIRIDAPPAKDR